MALSMMSSSLTNNLSTTRSIFSLINPIKTFSKIYEPLDRERRREEVLINAINNPNPTHINNTLPIRSCDQ